MRIALFTDTYDEVNGVSNTFHKLVEYAKKHDKQLEVFTLANANKKERIGKHIIIHRYKPRLPIQLYEKNKFDLRFLHEDIIGYFKNNHFNLIHTATPGSMGLTALFIARWFNIPLIGSYHTSLPEYVQKMVDDTARKINWFDKKVGKRFHNATWSYMKWYYNKCRLVLSPSQFTCNQLKRKLSTKIRIFSRGVDTKLFHPAKFKFNRKSIALYVGRLSIEKNLDILIKCFSSRKDCMLKFVGSGPYEQELKKRLPNAKFLGYLSGKRLARAYSKADFFLFPSTTDSFGNVVLEAMASGLPVIVSNKMGPRELVANNVNGYVSSLKDFNDKIDILVRNKKHRKKMGKEARHYALTRSWTKVFEQLFKDYSTIAK